MKKKPPSRRTEAKEEVQRIAELFAALTITTFSFGKFTYPITIQEIKLAKTSKSTPGGMKNPPEMRTDDEGKQYTPPVMQITTADGLLYFILEDIEVVSITNGLRIITAANNIDFRE